MNEGERGGGLRLNFLKKEKSLIKMLVYIAITERIGRSCNKGIKLCQPFRSKK